MSKVLKSSSGNCKTCGSNLFFNPETQTLDCESCKSKQVIDSKVEITKHNLEELDAANHHKTLILKNNKQSMKCSNCGASVVLTKFETATSCPYCNSNLIANKEQIAALEIDSIIPFKFGKEKARQMFKEKLKSKWFISGKFLKSLSSQEISSFYFPSFIFDSDCSTTYNGRLYNEETIEDSDGNRRTVKKYFNILGKRDTKHKDVIIEASTKLQQNELNYVKPYNLNEMKAYSDEYIYGYPLEQYSNTVGEAYLQAQDMMKAEIRRAILSSYSHDGVSYFNMTPTFYNKKYLYCVLPMYRINYSYKNKNYSNVMNGQTGSLGGKYPKSGLKITFAILIPALFIVLPIIAAIIYFALNVN